MIHNISSIQREKVRTMQKDIRESKIVKKTDVKIPTSPKMPNLVEVVKKPIQIPEPLKGVKTTTPITAPTQAPKIIPPEKSELNQMTKPTTNVNNEQPIAMNTMPGAEANSNIKKPDAYRETVK